MRLIKKLTALLLVLAVLATVGCGSCSKKNDGGNEEPDGEFSIKDDKLKAVPAVADHNRVFYEIFVGSFSDSDGDGTGDLRGIINRMDYLNDGDPDSGRSLGVEGLWLSPIFQSPSYHKYDVTDYYKIDSKFGTEADLKELLDLCHERGVIVILDLPINHTGRLNSWFLSFSNAHKDGDTANEYYDFYTWYDGTVESAPAGRQFSQIPGTRHYYECNFAGDMPELNYDSPAVRQAVVDIANYYIDLGVDGFRFDAAKYVYFNDNAACMEFWTWYLGTLRSKKADIYTVAEVWDGDGITDLYFPAMNCFNFTISGPSGLIGEIAKGGNASRFASYVEAYQKRVGAMRDGAAITPFITNHDMDRAAGFLTPASGYAQMAANLYILGPGTPFIYYGEELGMCGSRGGASTDANRRLAMIWGDEDTVKDPVGATYPASSQIKSTAADQMKNENSLYNYYKKLLMIRRANPEIARGDYKAVSFDGIKAGGFISTYNGSSVLVIHNTTGADVEIDLSQVSGISVTELRAVIGLGGATLNGTTLTLEAQTSAVLK